MSDNQFRESTKMLSANDFIAVTKKILESRFELDCENEKDYYCRKLEDTAKNMD